MTDKKISELDAITGSNTAATDVFVVVDTSTGQTKKITREELNNAIEQDVLSSIDIDTINGDFSVNGNINLGDSDKAIFGAGNDLEILHDGTNSVIRDNGSGNLSLTTNGSKIGFYDQANTQFLAEFFTGAGIRLYYDGSQKFVTQPNGIDVTGTVTADGLTISSVSNQITLDTGDQTTYGRLDVGHFSNGTFIGTYAGTNAAANVMRFGTSGSERLRITDTGLVGIGTTSPEGTLHIENVSNNSVIMDAPANRFNSIGFQTAGVDKWWLGRADSDQISGDAFFIGVDNGNVTDAGGLSNKLVITQSGSVGIGTSSPDAQLDISSATTSTLRLSNTDTILTENQVTGQLEFYQADASSNPTGSGTGITGKIAMRSVPALGGGYFGIAADMDFNVSGQAEGYASDNASLTAMTIQAGSGFVGIGTSSPQTLLDISHQRSGTRPTLGAGTRFVIESTANNTAFTAATILGGNASGASILNLGDVNDEDVGQVSYHHSDNSMRFKTNANERLRIDSSGNVGIGTSSPSEKLEIQEGNVAIKSSTISQETPFYFMRDDSGQTADYVASIGMQAASSSDWRGVITFNAKSGSAYNNSTIAERMRLTAGGNLNVASPGSTDIGRLGGSVYSSGERSVYIWAGSAANYLQLSGRNVADSTASILLRIDNTTRAEIEANGDFLSATNSYGSTSDQTLKENIIDSGSQWDDIKAVQVKKFSYIRDGLDSANMLGVVAQDLEASGMSGLVSTMEEGDGNTYKTVKYSILYMKAIKALQEAITKIEDLEARVATLEGN